MLSETAKKPEAKNFSKPDKVRTFPKAKIELIKLGDTVVGKATLEPGWRWSTSVGPLFKATTCEATHLQYHLSGTMEILMEDGTRQVCRAGDVSLLPKGHDGWVVGNEPVVIIDFNGMAHLFKE